MLKKIGKTFKPQSQCRSHPTDRETVGRRLGQQESQIAPQFYVSLGQTNQKSSSQSCLPIEQSHVSQNQTCPGILQLFITGQEQFMTMNAMWDSERQLLGPSIMLPYRRVKHLISMVATETLSKLFFVLYQRQDVTFLLALCLAQLSSDSRQHCSFQVLLILSSEKEAQRGLYQ